MNEIQDRRDVIRVPNGLPLHQYANLYFDYWNPMLSKRRDQNESICILEFDPAVLDLDGVIVTDRNASSDYVAFYPADLGLDCIDYSLIYAKYWTDPDPFEKMKKRSIKCAEVLVPDCIPYDYIILAAVFNDNAANLLKATGFNRKIIVEPRAFFREMTL